jgi:nucleolar GTP-binding protein
MNFQGLKHVETDKVYLDVAIKRTKKLIDEMRSQKLKGAPIQKSKTIEIEKLQSIERELRTQMEPIIKSFPSFDNMPEFYQQLINNLMDVNELKKSLASIKWCIGKNQEFLRMYESKIKLCTEITRINQYRREFYGRISSALKQIRNNLAYLEEARRVLLSFPSIKTSMPTVAIAGFPNVGKSTLLSKLTPAKPKIANYAFTTTGINLGYGMVAGKEIQFVDTPGTLARFELQNTVERIATLALKYIADAIIYVFDPSETYDVEKQLKLYEQVKKLHRPTIVYFSKTDVVDKERVNEFRKLFPSIVTSIDNLRKEIEKVEFL